MTSTKKRKLQAYQAYLHLYIDKIRPLVKERREKIMESLQPGEQAPDRLKLTIQVAKDAYKTETDDVIKMVERFREEHYLEEEDEEEHLRELKR